MRARLVELSRDAEVELVESSGGVFEITRDGRLLFSKKKLGRFPYDAEIDAFAK